MHILHSRIEITLEWMELFSEQYEMAFDATCQKCGKALTAGDWRDGLFPYEVDFNICWECLEKQKFNNK